MKLSLKEIENIIKDGNGIYIIFHDTETTGIKKDDRILQSAHALYRFKNSKIEFIDYLEENILPPVPIGPASAAVHGIWYPDLNDSPEFKNSQTKLFFDLFIENEVYYCAHNSDFDIGQLEKEGIFYPQDLVIDTLQIAKHFNKDNDDIESNGLQYLRYFYNFDMSDDFTSFISNYGIEKLQPHTALSDIAVLAYYFQELLKMGAFKDLSDAVKMTNTVVISDKVTFGNVFEKGTKISEAITSTYKQYGKNKNGIDYFNWAISNMEGMQPDIKISIAKHVMDKCLSGELNINSNSVYPMKLVAAAFLPEYSDFLSKSGINIESAKNKVLDSIKGKIKEIENRGEEDESRVYSSLKKILKYA